MKIKQLIAFLLFTLLILGNKANSKEFIFNSSNDGKFSGNFFGVLEDTSNSLSFEAIVNSKDFRYGQNEVLNFGISKSTFWLKTQITNKSNKNQLFISIEYPILDHIELFEESKSSDGQTLNSPYLRYTSGEQIPISKRGFNNQNFVFTVYLKPGESKVLFFKIKSAEQILVPVIVATSQKLFERLNTEDILSAFYCGLILVMILYNSFIYFSVKDKSYLYYVIYITFVGLTQLSFQGFTYRFFWPDSPIIANHSVIVFPAITGIAAIVFFRKFLLIENFTKTDLYILNILVAFYLINCTLSILGYHQLSQKLLQPNALIASVAILYMAAKAFLNGSRPAGFFIIAWAAFLLGIIIFILKDIGLLPYNTFTIYILQVGSALEVVLLSFALADKINILKKEKERSQVLALQAARENEYLVQQQNIILENRVMERTQELQEANQVLENTLKDLKEAESQLVESEKMASLGQLTAGIAHEINNPINFVTSNVSPLKRDIDTLLDLIDQMESIGIAEGNLEEKRKKLEALKEETDYDYIKHEIEFLLKGIEDGAARTAEIVKGLRIFSRLDEDDLKKADIHDGLNSTLVIINHQLNNAVQIEKNYADLPLIECYPGKLNQVFLNIMSNAIHAIHKRWNGNPGGKLTLTTSGNQEQVQISIKDNGTGMSEETQKKLFEPFFTTKDIGEGTGLGLSIVYNTIKKHNGTIVVTSEVGKGTEFLITLPVINITAPA